MNSSPAKIAISAVGLLGSVAGCTYCTAIIAAYVVIRGAQHLNSSAPWSKVIMEGISA